jgi:1-acyl-sn-glycerol-3-phosphate acyltransferase
LCALTLHPLDGLLFKLRWGGLEHVPKAGGALLVANHVSYFDPVTFVRFVWDAGRIPRILVKSSLFAHPIVGPVVRGARQIPVERNSAAAKDSLTAAAQALRDGEAVCIYPEGTVTRDPDWWPMRSRTGVARLALSADVPVIPIAQWGPQFFYDKYNHRFRPLPRKTVRTVAGPPVDLSRYRGREVTGELLREVTDVIMGAVREQLADIRGEAPPVEFWEPPAEPSDSVPAAPMSEPAPANDEGS